MTNSSEGFIPEIETMDLSKIRDKQFVVGISTGNRDAFGMLISTLRGPYDFIEMIDVVRDMWFTQMNNAKVIILNKDFTQKLEWLDAKTIDYLISKGDQVIVEEFLLSPNYTCEVGIVRDQEETDGTLSG